MGRLSPYWRVAFPVKGEKKSDRRAVVGEKRVEITGRFEFQRGQRLRGSDFSEFC